jgi:hypothetical protein
MCLARIAAGGGAKDMLPFTTHSRSSTNLSYTITLRRMLNPMDTPAAFSMLIATAQSLVAAVTARDNLYLRPAFVRKAVAGRLASGLVVLRAFLRRLIILMALHLEWGLVDTRGAMKRPHGQKSSSSAARFTLPLLEIAKASPWQTGNGPQFKAVIIRTSAPREVNIDPLYAKLSYLAGIAANPMAKARRLAFHLARKHRGMIMAPKGPTRIAGRWGTEVSAFYDAMAGELVRNSCSRPPPLPPRRTHWPTITLV